jgi:hypothetical protein
MKGYNALHVPISRCHLKQVIFCNPWKSDKYIHLSPHIGWSQWTVQFQVIQRKLCSQRVPCSNLPHSQKKLMSSRSEVNLCMNHLSPNWSRALSTAESCILSQQSCKCQTRATNGTNIIVDNFTVSSHLQKSHKVITYSHTPYHYSMLTFRKHVCVCSLPLKRVYQSRLWGRWEKYC